MSAMTPVVKVWIPIHLALLAVAYAWLFQQSALDLSIAIGLWFFLIAGFFGETLGSENGKVSAANVYQVEFVLQCNRSARDIY